MPRRKHKHKPDNQYYTKKAILEGMPFFEIDETYIDLFEGHYLNLFTERLFKAKRKEGDNALDHSR